MHHYLMQALLSKQGFAVVTFMLRFNVTSTSAFCLVLSGHAIRTLA